MVVIAILFFSFFGVGLSQYQQVYLRPNYNQVSYYQSQPQPHQPILSNVINSEPILNYVPVYNTDYGNWPKEKSKSKIINSNSLDLQPLIKMPNYPVPVHPIRIQQFQRPTQHVAQTDRSLQRSDQSVQQIRSFNESSNASQLEFKKLSKVIDKLQAEMKRLNAETKEIHASKSGDVMQIEKLRSDLKLALKNTEVLKTDLNEHEKQLVELWNVLKRKNETTPMDKMLTEGFSEMVERLEGLVDNLTRKSVAKKCKSSRHCIH